MTDYVVQLKRYNGKNHTIKQSVMRLCHNKSEGKQRDMMWPENFGLA